MGRKLLTDIEVKGIDGVNDALLALGDKGARAAAKSASTRAMEITLKKAKALAPKVTKFLSKSLKKKIRAYPRSGTIVSMVGVDSKAVQPDPLNKTRDQKPIKYAHIVHGKHNNKYMFNALKSTQQQVLSAYARYIRAAIARETRKQFRSQVVK